MNSEKKEIYALGVGHNTPVLLDWAMDNGWHVAGLYHYNDTRTGEVDHGFPILGSFNDLFSRNKISAKNFLLTMGDNHIRTELSERILALGGKVPSIVHSSAVISPFATVSDIGVYIGPHSVVQADTTIGANVFVSVGVNISHTNKVGKACFFAGGSILGAYTTVKDFVFFGLGAISISGKVNVIESDAYIGARSLLTHDVPAHAVVAGTPAKILKYKH